MKLTRLFLYGIALISALLITRTYFTMDRPAEHVDVEEATRKAEREAWDKEWNDLMRPGSVTSLYRDQGTIWKSADKIKAIQGKLNGFSEIIASKNLKTEDKLDLLEKMVTDIKAVEDYDKSNIQQYTKIKTDLLKQLEKPVNEYFAQKEKSILGQIQGTQPVTQKLVVDAYQREFKMLNTFLKDAQELHLPNDVTIINTAKRLLRLNKVLTASQALPSQRIAVTDLEKIISSDTAFIDATRKLAYKQIQQPLLLPEDMLPILLNRFEDTEEDVDRIKILWSIDQVYKLLVDEKDRKQVRDILNNFLDELRKNISQNTTHNGDLGDPNEERDNRVRALEQYNDFLKKSTIFGFNDKATTLKTMIDVCLKKTQDYDKKLRNQLNDAIQGLAEALDTADLATLLKGETENLKKINELLEKSKALDDYSYEKFAGQDFQRTLNAWRQVINASKYVDQYLRGFDPSKPDPKLCAEAYPKIQKAKIDIQTELDYNQQYQFADNPITRDFRSRTLMMNTQGLILGKLSKLLHEKHSDANPKYALVDLLSLPDNEKTKKLLINQKLLNEKGLPTDLGNQLKQLAVLTASIDRRIQQLQLYVNKNKTEPQSLKSIAGVPIRLAYDLRLQLLIPDDQISLLQKTFEKVIPIWPTDRDSFLQYMQTHILTQENIRIILELSSIIASIKQGDLALLKQEFNNPVLAAIVDYTAEIARAPATERVQKGQEFYDIYRRYPSLVRGWGLNEEQILITLNANELNAEKITYEQEYAKSLADVTEKAQTELEKTLLAERAKKARFLTGLAIPAALAAAEAVYHPPLWWRITLGVFLGIGGAIGGAILGAFAGGAGAIPGAIGGAMAGYGLGDRIAIKLWEWQHKGSGLEFADQLSGGRATPLVAAGVGLFVGWKMWASAQAMRPTDTEYSLLRARFIKIGSAPELRQEESPIYQPLVDLWHNLFDDEINPKHRALQSQIVLVRQREKDYNDARIVYFDILNEALNLKGIQRLTPTSSYNYYIEVETKFNEQLKKLDKKTRELFRERTIKAKKLMLQMGIEWTGMQFEYSRSEMNMMSNIIYVQLLGQATADPSSPEFLETLKKGWDSEGLKKFREIWERKYADLKDEKAIKEAGIKDFSDWLDFYNRLFTVHDIFLKTLEANKDTFSAPFGEDGKRIYGLYQDMLNGRIDNLMTSYRTTVDSVLDAWGRPKLIWGTAPETQVKTVVA